MQVLNDPRPWWAMMPGAPRSMVDLISNGTIPAAAAGALWWAVERGASMFVAAGPQGAGKTTLATALFSFLPDDARAYVTAGPRDPLDLPPLAGAPTYLLINELSSHTPVYLAGAAARRAFALLGEGVRVIGTLHADSVAEAVAVMEDESGIPRADIGRVDLIAVLRARRVGYEVERRVAQIGLLRPSGCAIDVADVAAWDTAAGRLLTPLAPDGVAALAAWGREPLKVVEQQIAARAEFLTDLWRRGVHTWNDVGAGVRWFRRRERGRHASA